MRPVFTRVSCCLRCPPVRVVRSFPIVERMDNYDALLANLRTGSWDFR
jgi:hypothetical protein